MRFCDILIFLFGWDFPIGGLKLAVFGYGDPQNVNFNDSNPQKARVSTEPRLKILNVLWARVTSGLWDGLGKKKKGTKVTKLWQTTPSCGRHCLIVPQNYYFDLLPPMT